VPFGKKDECERALMGNSEGKKPLRGYRYRWKDNIEIYHTEYDGPVWNGLMCLMTGTAGELL
jgi:hypothetical protein